MRELRHRLESLGIQPSAQRLAIAAYVLNTHVHPSADRVWQEVKAHLPMVSRATVYNTLKLFVQKGLLRQVVLEPGNVLFDARTERHHHFVDDVTGEITDVPWDALNVTNVNDVKGLTVRDYEVVLRGTKQKGNSSAD